MGHCVLRVASVGAEPSDSEESPTLSTSYLEWALSKRHPNLKMGGLRLPYGEYGLYQFLRAFSACEAGSLWDVADTCLSDPEGKYFDWPVNPHEAWFTPIGRPWV